MKKIIIFLGIAILCLCACSNVTIAQDEEKEYERFKTIYKGDCFNVVYDIETKVQYSVSMRSYNYGNLTLLVDAEGKPLLYKEE